MSAQGIRFEAIAVFDGTRILHNQRVLAEQGVITSVGPTIDPPPAPASQLVVAGAGRTLLPGFIDTHVHIGLHDPAAVLRGGVTTARDLGWAPGQIFPLASYLAGHPLAGPRLLAAGPMLTAPGGYPSRAGWAPAGTAVAVGDAGEAGQAVESAAAAGACIIKVAQEPRGGPVMAPATLAAVVRHAHALGLKVTSHAGSAGQVEIALEAGVDELAHGLWSDEVLPGAVIARMAGAGMAVIPTLHIDPSTQRIRNLARFHEAGGRVVYGTDMGNTGLPPGIDPRELDLMVAAGMSRLAVLASATRLAADHLGLGGLGRIEPGCAADLVVVEGDPAKSFGCLGNPAMVFREGQPCALHQ